MNRLKKILLIVIVLNLLAGLGGIGWLFTSGRVSKDRVLTLTDLFTEPVAVEQAAIKAEEARIAKELAEQERPLPQLALNTDERNLVRVEMTQIDRQRLDRMKREVDDLQATLRKERRLLEQDREELIQEQEEFDQMRQRLAGLEGTVQFKKALASLSEMKAKDAKTVLGVLLSEAKSEEVVTYLSSMDDGVRTAILSEFVKAGEEQLAADLLESIRLRGLETTMADMTE